MVENNLGGGNEAQMLAFYTVVWTMHSEDDRAFFQQLYIDYELMMFKKALTVLRNEEESLDAVSDACLMLMKRISTLRQLSDMSLRRYIIITVEHASINRLRRMKRINQYSFTVDEEWTQEPAANEMPIEEQVIIAAEKRRLKKAIQKLSEKEQWILSMRFDEELTYKQIAQQIGVKPQNIGGILERTYKHLRRILEEVELN